MINKQPLKRQKFLCVISAMHVIFCTQEDRFYIHTFTLTEYDSYKYQGYQIEEILGGKWKGVGKLLKVRYNVLFKNKNYL